MSGRLQIGNDGAMTIEYVDFHFDVMCPWAYQTSRWIREVRDLTGLDVRWRFFSLEEINRVEGKKHPWERPWSFGWSQMRIAAYLRRGPDGNAAVDRWYEATGRAFHEDGRETHVPDVQRDVLRETGFDPDVLDRAIDDPTTTDEVRSLLIRELSLEPDEEVYVVSGLLDPSALWSLYERNRPDLKDVPWTPVTQPRLGDVADFFALLQKGDLLVHHPYDSFETSVEAFIEHAAQDPTVLAIKLALALTTPGVDVHRVVQTQRSATMRTLQEYTRLKAGTDTAADLAWRLVLDAMVFQSEAEVRWLDHCEASLARFAPIPTPPVAAAPTDEALEMKDAR